MDFLTDTFTFAGFTLLSAHSPDVGGAWTLDAGSGNDMFVASGQCSMTGGGAVGYTNSAAPPGADYSASVGMHGDIGVSNQQSIGIRKNAAAGNRYEAKFIPPNALQLNKVLAGATSTLDSTTISLPDLSSPPVTIEISAIGSALAVKVNGAPTLSATDSSVTATGLVGFDGVRTVGQPLYMDNLHAFAPAPTLLRRGEFVGAGSRGSG